MGAPLNDPFPSAPKRSIRAADLAILILLAVVTTSIALAVARGLPLVAALVLHAGLLAGWVVLVLFLSRRADTGWVGVVRGIGVITIVFTLYTTLGYVAFEAIPWNADPLLDRADRALFGGVSPSLALEPWVTPGVAEALSFFYAAYIPYLYMSLFLGLIGRPDRERSAFVTGFAVLYLFGLLGYLFLPARGPIVELASAFGEPLRGGFFHGMVTRSIDQLGGPHGAFPSLHLGASLYVCRFDFQHGNPLRGLIYIPLVAMIAVATIALRYHYVVDLIAGSVLALGAGWIATRLTGRSTA